MTPLSFSLRFQFHFYGFVILGRFIHWFLRYLGRRIYIECSRQSSHLLSWLPSCKTTKLDSNNITIGVQYLFSLKIERNSSNKMLEIAIKYMNIKSDLSKPSAYLRINSLISLFKCIDSYDVNSFIRLDGGRWDNVLWLSKWGRGVVEVIGASHCDSIDE